MKMKGKLPLPAKLAIAILVASVVFFISMAVNNAVASEQPTGTTCVAAYVTDVKDGDTYNMVVAAWPEPFRALPLRPLAIDAPEFRSQCDTQEARDREVRLAGEATDVARELLLHKVVLVCNYRLGPFNRILGDIHVDGQDVGKYLTSAGLARPYQRGKNPWCVE